MTVRSEDDCLPVDDGDIRVLLAGDPDSADVTTAALEGESGYSTATEGTGFGLAIVEAVADAYGWEVRAVESDDGGARFEVTGVEEPT